MKPWDTHTERNIKTIALQLMIWAPISTITGGDFDINYTGTATIGR